MSKIAIVIFDDFTDLDLFLMWDLLNRVKVADWSVKILGSSESHVSKTGISITTHGRIEEANDADAVLFVSGGGTRARINDEEWLSKFKLDPARQMIGSVSRLSTSMRETPVHSVVLTAPLPHWTPLFTTEEKAVATVPPLICTVSPTAGAVVIDRVV